MIGADFDILLAVLLGGCEHETCAVGFATLDEASETWVLDNAMPVPERAYAKRDEVSASLKTDYVVDIVNRARLTRTSPVLFHTHPHASGVPRFSACDDQGEADLKAYFDHRIPDLSPLAVVVGPNGCMARRLGKAIVVPVWAIGAEVRLLSDEANVFEGLARHDRQVRAFGQSGQRMISRLRMLVVGAGGTGSLVMQQLAHLGALDVTIIDPDRVEETNLNRLIGARAYDVGTPKVEVARRMAQSINPQMQVHTIIGDIVDEHQADLIGGFDFVFLCTDSHASRAVVCQAAYQFLVPVIDMGVSITAAVQGISHITGRVQMLAPGLPCLTCTGALDGEQIRREMITPEQRAADPYLIGMHEPQPAVVSINSTMASLAVTMFLGAVTPVPTLSRFQLYDGIRGTVRPTTAARRSDCIVCSAAGALAKGSAWSLPVRPSGPA